FLSSDRKVHVAELAMQEVNPRLRLWRVAAGGLAALQRFQQGHQLRPLAAEPEKVWIIAHRPTLERLRRRRHAPRKMPRRRVVNFRLRTRFLMSSVSLTTRSVRPAHSRRYSTGRYKTCPRHLEM